MAKKQGTTRAKAPAKVMWVARVPADKLWEQFFSPEVGGAVDQAIAWFRALRDTGLDGPALETAKEQLQSATEQAAQLLFDSPVGQYFDSFERLQDIVAWVIEGSATAVIPSRPFGNFDTIKADQKSRIEVRDDKSVWILNGAPDDELVQLFPVVRWQVAAEEGRLAHLYGRSRKSVQEFYEVLEVGLKRCAGARLTQELLSGHMAMDTHTLRGYLRDYGPTWQMLKKYPSLLACEAHGWKQS